MYNFITHDALQGWSREDAAIATKFTEEWQSYTAGRSDKDGDSMFRPLLKIMCREVAKQHKRLGGDFAVAHLVMSKKSRDFCRAACPNVVFITLALTENCQQKRLEGRHAGQNAKPFQKLFQDFEPAGDEEENAYKVMISEDMTKDDVLHKVLEIIRRI